MIEWDIDKFLLCCVRGRYDGNALDEARQIAHAAEIDWDRFLHQSVVHGVAPLVYDTLRDDRQLLPDWVTEQLRAAYYQVAANNALLYEELAAMVRAFDQAGIPVLLLKGAALAQGTYGSVALRPMSDLDILVGAESMVQAAEVLAREGYSDLVSPHSRERHVTLKNPTRGPNTLIELHSHIVSSPYYRQAIPEEWLWQNLSVLVMDGLPVSALSPEATIVHGCLHFLDHTAVRGTLIWLCDIAEVAQQAQVDWEDLAGVLGEFKIALPVRQLLETCQDVLGLSLPEHALDSIRALRPGFVEKRAYEFCLSGSRSTVSKTLFDFLATPGLAPRARLLSSRLFPPRSYIEARYSVSHSALVPFYYGRMILDAILDGIRALR